MDYLTNKLKLIGCILALCVANILFSQESDLILKIKASGSITDFYADENQIILSTDQGIIEQFDILNGRRSHLITLPEMKDFTGKAIPTKIYSIDKSSDNIVAIAHGIHGFRNVLIINNGETRKIIDSEKDKLIVKKTRFVNESQVLLGLLSNELILFDIDKNESIYKLEISPYTFSDFCLSEDHQFVFTTDESGAVHMIDITNGKIKKEFTGNNMDNVYQVDAKNGIILTAGQDRRVGYYNTISMNKYFLQKDFLVYSAGLNSDATIGAYCASEENDVTLFNLENRKELKTLTGHKSLVTKIEFIDKHTLITAAEDGVLMIWKID